MSRQGDCYQSKCPGDILQPYTSWKWTGTLLCFSASVSTPLGVVMSGLTCSELLLSGSHHPESLYNAKSDCQTNARRLGLLHSQAESHKPWQPGYLLHHTRLLLPLNCSVMESTFCHHLHCCLLPMRDIIKIKSQGKGPAQLTINQWVVSINLLTLIYLH